MNYYPHHIGDFNSATRHLTRVERSIYRDLIDIYYDTEAALPADMDRLCRLAIARSDEERTAVAQVLQEFFVQTDAGWTHDRCEREIAKYRGLKEAKSAAGKASAAARSRKLEQPNDSNSTAVEQVLNECATNQEPRTKNQEEQEQKALVPSADDTSAYSAEFEEFWAEYPKREGGNSKKGAHKAWNARLRSGVKAEDLILSAKRYADQMQAKGNVGTSFVKQAATFLGPDEHWREALASNIHPLRTTASGGVVKGDSRNCPPLTRKGDFEYWNAIENRWEVRNTETHDPATGYAWSYLKSRGQA